MTVKDELQVLSLKLTEIGTRQKVQTEATNSKLDELGEKLDKVSYALDGNGKPGLKTRVDRLEQQSKIKNAILWVLFTTSLASIATLIVSQLQ